MQQEKSYHHGALREALLAAAEIVLRRDGLAALTLRAIARDAGVSHGAPAHHFKDLAELLSELAAVGFERMVAALRNVADEGDGDGRRFSAAAAYLAFATDNPALFQLMFRSERLNPEHERLRLARAELFFLLSEFSHGSIAAPSLSQLGAMTAQWCLVYGFASLAVDGRLGALLRIAPEGTQASELLQLALVHLVH